MGKLIFITGGARSGKSSYAEKLAISLGGDILYIATSKPFDEEMKERVKKHRERRPKNWGTLEAYKDFDSKLLIETKGKSGVLLDCITNMVTNLIFEKLPSEENITTRDAEKVQKYVEDEIEKLIRVIENIDMPFIIVTNEVGMSLVPEYPLGRLFRDIAGFVNQMLAKKADEVYLCISGIPMKIK
ncbi:adenosylcobinamide kinase/adenosylcobinamide-phosphate guanylyltransferase [Clostridium acetobutylicum]|uniref:Adenosylcobinamide kinase n=1 Tax=Clostridium acetobutylicum (strain ATCC 824 / DSM 792 / JCM 1419 / IAM 19013 / LMG 5710 / NBRC 13948 / NRRL B-527 / VKM B-1787 / 2291 / W) TaxID=272562 RepID=Q97JA3_CLOAB|nr:MULTISPECIES: bifunctional adenosylcobinamide kinase/adenosylcobinamide-phosphate guanylyltransferase [Clostridium]AAK79351.1 Adenosyl cobinamide kinase/adenosyl cobinamide phosphate [Clostridium acetobutylicum ATCC 824]ADZ20434.1 adenosylcobinamide kinase/adenosylcobinamide-phosphate guanylyltransferase [Clostridium acetobutylicum EA 2018]AEI33147.1 adenosylcobinamide kinase/adenosylcobinamide-phosphate guanylyltransferase [Clostridium acetobutylicum DSM 1731]AWV81400.1 bifunctional adenosy